jgi:steroid delta-isomerase-like uncharacterized protein
MASTVPNRTDPSIEENKARSRRFIAEVIQRRNFDAIDELVALDVVDHSAHPGQAAGREGYKQSVEMLLGAFPGAEVKIEDMLAEGDEVAVRWTLRGRHEGPLLDLPATGRPITFTGIVISRYRGGVIAEEWMQWDMLGLLQQLGAVPTAQVAAD